MSTEWLTIDLYVVRQTENAIAVSEDQENDDLIWLPKSLVDGFDPDKIGEVQQLSMRQTLAYEKGLI